MILADTASSLSADQVLLAMIALMGIVISGFFALIRSVYKSSEKHQTDMVRSNTNNNKALNRIASATERGNKEAEARNGHLAELVVQQGEANKTLANTAIKTIVSAIANVPEQHIEHAHIEHQEIAEVKKGKK